MKKISEIVFKYPIHTIIAYLLMHFLVRIYLSDTIQVDDREQILYGQTLNLGYPMPQPPLYSWIVWLFFKILGTSLFTVSIVKYLLLAFTYIVIWSICKKIFQTNKVKVLGLFSFLLLPSFFWHIHEGFTHTVILGLAILMTTNSYFNIQIDSSIKNYSFLGLSIGIGLLSKYSFLIFLLLFLLATLSRKDFRDVLFKRGIFITFIIASLIALPHYYWLAENFNSISNQAMERVSIGYANNIGSLRNLQLPLSYLGFLTPLIFIITPFLIRKKNKTDNIVDPYLIFFRSFFLILFALSVFFSFSFEIEQVKVRWLHPLLLLAPLWLVSEYQQKHQENNKFIRNVVFFTIFLSLIVIGSRVVKMTIGPELGFYGRINIPISQTLKKIPHNILEGSTIKILDYSIFAHSFEAFPNNTLQFIGKKFNDKKDKTQKCLILDISPIESLAKPALTGSFVTFRGKFKYEIFYSLEQSSSCKF